MLHRPPSRAITRTVLAAGCRAGVEPSTISFNTAISACAKTADWENALALFRRMEASGIERTTVTYTGLINACAEGMQLDKAMALFTYMEVSAVAVVAAAVRCLGVGLSRCRGLHI